MKRIAWILLIVLFTLLAFPAVAFAQSGEPGAPGTITPDLLASVAGILLSLVFSYGPKLNTKFEALPDEYKRLIMVGLLAVVAVGAYGISCTTWLSGIFKFSVTCDPTGRQLILRAFILALVANQSTHRASPKTPAVRELKAVQEGKTELLAGRG